MSEPETTRSRHADDEAKILVLDSDRQFQQLATQAVAKLGLTQILCCATTAEALHRMEKFVPRLIIIEGRLGGAGAINFVRRMRAGQTKAAPGTPAIFVAQDFSGGLSGKLCEIGCQSILRKPVPEETLTRAIVRVMTDPVPIVQGGNYLGPDRRRSDGGGSHEPERRRNTTLGGWTKSFELFRTENPPPRAVRLKRPLKPTGGAPAAPPKKAPPVATTAQPPMAMTAPPDAIEPTESSRLATVPKTPSPQAGDRIKPRPQADTTVAAKETPTKKEAPPSPNEDAAPAAAAADAGPVAFDLDVAVAQHREWITSNGTRGARVNLEGMALPGAVLNGQNLAKANLRGTDLTSADLRTTILVDADLRNACLAQALLNDAELAGAKIRHADLQAAQMPAAGLQGADLAGADLRGAMLAGADVAGANFLGADLCGADLTVVNLSQKQLDRAFGNASTRLPPGFVVAQRES